MGKDSELMQAVKNSDVSTVRKLLLKFKSSQKGKKSVSKKIHINIPDEDGFTVLHHAALVNNIEIVLALLEMEADPNSRDKKGMCPLHMAAWAGQDKIVKTLLDNRALVNLPSFSGETPLLLASQHGYAKVVEVLMKFSADPSIRNNNLESPLDLACQFGHAAVVRLLLMRGEVVHMLRERQTDARYKQPLHLAAKGGHADVARLLVESGADVNEQNLQGTSLHLAALYGKVEVLKLLIEAGADVRAVNKKNMTPLDMVNQFTTSSAGIEIKQLLREAAGDHVVFAKALTDQINVYDDTNLSFKAGATITVLEQNEDGRWKGSISDGKVEKVGYFPAKTVSIISSRRETQSLGSLSSSSDSSINSALSGKEGNQAVKSPSRRMRDSNKPVGVVPVGTYEVLTLAPTQGPDSKKPPNIPRLNSFKKDSKAGATQKQKILLREDYTGGGMSSNRSSSADTSNDSGIHSHSPATIMETTYDTISGPPQSLESIIYDPVPQPKSPRIFPTQLPVEHPEQREQVKEHNGSHPGMSYAEIAFKSDKSVFESPVRTTNPSYSDVYVAEAQAMEPGDTRPRVHSEARNIPQTPNKTLEFRESYENMNLNEELLAKIGRTPEEKTILRSSSEIHGYEDMRGSFSSGDELFPSPPPPLPLKSPSPSNLTPSPPKKIESRAIHRHQDSYENIEPRQMVPVHVQNPFEAANKSEPDDLSRAAVGPSGRDVTEYPEYENFAASAGTMPPLSKSTYENFMPSNVVPQGQKPRAATVTEKPVHPASTRPVPLPPKMNRRSCQEPVSPASPAFDPVKTPFFSQLNPDELTQDEKELLTWLTELKLPQYFQNFQLEGYDMVSVRGVTPEDLTAIEITKAGHRKKLLSEITKLGPSSRLPAYKPDEVGAWLTLLGLRVYENNFIEGGFDEMDFIKDLDLSDLEMIEIRKKGHQKKLLLAVQKLSDMELTAELDAVVAVSKGDMKTSHSQVEKLNIKEKTEELIQHEAVDSNPLPPESPLKPPRMEMNQDSSEDLAFPVPPPVSELESAFLPKRDNLPPPSGKESTSASADLTATAPTPSPAPAPLPPKAPFRVSSEKINHPPNQDAQRPKVRAGSLPVAPKPKPKPRPAQNVGQVRTASEYHATESPTVIMPSTPQKPALQTVGEDSESAVTAARSRDFWLQGQQQPLPTSTSNVTPTRTKSMSGIKPVPSQRPTPTPRPSGQVISKPDNTTANTDSSVRLANDTLGRKSSLKKVPPPAPPRRDSMSGKRDSGVMQVAQNSNEAGVAERSRTFSGPLDEKIREAFRGKAQMVGPVQAPIMEQAPEETTDAAKANIDDELAATDSIMADIDDMIADFTSQLDSMF